MTVLLRLTEARLRRVAWRLFGGMEFTVAVPEGLVRTHRRWRVALITADSRRVSWDGDTLEFDPAGPPSILAVARMRGSPRPTTTDDRVVVDEAFPLQPPLSLATLLDLVPDAHQPRLRQAAQELASEFDEPIAGAILGTLINLRPELRDVIQGLVRPEQPLQGEEAPTIAMERDAVHLALAFAGIDLDEGSWSPQAAGSYLDRLAYAPREQSLSGYDAGRFPDWQPVPGHRTDWTTFSDGQSYVRVGNVNDTKLEHVLGVDLVYRHLNNDTFVLVQYKKMEQSVESGWGYRPDGKFDEQLAQLRMIDEARGDADGKVETWRLFPRGCFVKLVRSINTVDPTINELLPGIYLPISYFDTIRSHRAALGRDGGEWFGYSTVDRYLTTSLFVDLVRQGWIGTSGVTTKAVEILVEAAVGRGHSLIVADEVGRQPGRSRRRRPQRISRVR